jgi:hypothetical protein
MALDIFNNVSDLTIPLFALYLLVFCNFTKETMGCRLSNVLDNNMYAKHFISFLLLFFLVIIIDPENSEKSILINFGLTIVIYMLYMITTRVSFPIMIMMLIIMMIMYILSKLSKKKLEEKKEDEYNNLKLTQNILFIIFIILGSIGFSMYFYEKYREYEGKFSVLKFIFGNPVCRKYTPDNAKII